MDLIESLFNHILKYIIWFTTESAVINMLIPTI